MNIKVTLKSVVIAAFTAGVVGIASYLVIAPGFSESNPVVTLVNEGFGWRYPSVKFPLTGPNDVAYSDIRDPGGIPEGLPIRLKIPAIGVDSAIEDALITPDGRMDVPSGSVNVAWFALGPHPGQTGSAVIGGHFGIRNGVKFVFYDLDKMKVGDKIYIEDDKGNTLAFQVREVKLFDREADATSVFTSSDGLAHLNLITCEGIWNRIDGNYPKRRVVFTDAIAAEAIAPFTPMSVPGITKAEDIATFPRTFGLGAQGADVTALQSFLEQKRFLTMPSGIAKGFFGAITSSAVARYQTSAGLSPVGVFGPQTRAKVLAELGGDTGLPNAGDDVASPTTSAQGEIETSGGESVSPVSSPTITRVIKGLFATPFDGLITVLLLAALAFVGVKIARR